MTLATFPKPPATSHKTKTTIKQTKTPNWYPKQSKIYPTKVTEITELKIFLGLNINTYAPFLCSNKNFFKKYCCPLGVTMVTLLITGFP